LAPVRFCRRSRFQGQDAGRVGVRAEKAAVLLLHSGEPVTSIGPWRTTLRLTGRQQIV
jgi:hypothetical protein